MEQRGETVTSANPTETVPSIRHLQFRFQHASLYMHVSSEKKYLSTSTLKKKKKKKKSFPIILCQRHEAFKLLLLWAGAICPVPGWGRDGRVYTWAQPFCHSTPCNCLCLSVPWGHSWDGYCEAKNFLKVKVRISSCSFLSPCVAEASLPCLWVGDLLPIPSPARPMTSSPLQKNSVVV